MTYNEIMQEITSGLTGDYKKDCAYLKNQMEKYNNHNLSKEILRACGRLMFDILPDDKKEELSRVI